MSDPLGYNAQDILSRNDPTNFQAYTKDYTFDPMGTNLNALAKQQEDDFFQYLGENKEGRERLCRYPFESRLLYTSNNEPKEGNKDPYNSMEELMMKNVPDGSTPTNNNYFLKNNNSPLYTTQTLMANPQPKFDLNRGLNYLIMDTIVLAGVSYLIDPEKFTEKLKMAAGASVLIQASSMTGIRNVHIIPDWSKQQQPNA